MSRILFGLLGVIIALAPDRTIAVFESLAVTDEEPPTRNGWVRSGARAEGIVIALASLVGGKLYATVLGLTGLAGVALVAAPRRYLGVASGLVYEEPDTIIWHDRIDDALRLIGLVYLLIALRTLRRQNQ